MEPRLTSDLHLWSAGKASVLQCGQSTWYWGWMPGLMAHRMNTTPELKPETLNGLFRIHQLKEAKRYFQWLLLNIKQINNKSVTPALKRAPRLLALGTSLGS